VTGPGRLWSVAILGSAVAAAVGSLAPPGEPLRMLVESWFLLVCPGMAIVRLLRLQDGLAEWCLAVALSLTLDALVPDVMVYAGVWSPDAALASLVVLSAVAAGLALRPRAAVV
jgi:hypothetical protein